MTNKQLAIKYLHSSFYSLTFFIKLLFINPVLQAEKLR